MMDKDMMFQANHVVCYEVVSKHQSPHAGEIIFLYKFVKDHMFFFNIQKRKKKRT